MAQSISRKLSIQNKSTDDIYIDTDSAKSQSNTVKSDLADLCTSLKKLKSIYVELRDHPKTKGKFKKTVNKMVNGASNKLNKTKTVKNSLESSMAQSINDYQEAMNSFNELDQMADDLGNE